MAASFQCVDKVPSHKKRAVILRNEMTKDPVDQLNVELFKILRLRFAPLRMTNSEFVYSLTAELSAAVNSVLNQLRTLCQSSET